MSTIVGIDPGASGAIAHIDDDQLLGVIDMPNHDGVVSAPLVAAHLRDLLDALGGVVAYVEAVHAMPKQGVASSFKFGQAHGTVLGVLGALHIPTHFVTPGKWKKHLGLGRDKTVSRRRACELWPEQADLFARVKDDGRAEAALIALYGQQTTNTQAPRSIP